MERGDLTFLYDDEGDINIPFPELRCDDSEAYDSTPARNSKVRAIARGEG